jgi:hypothetical protein
MKSSRIIILASITLLALSAFAAAPPAKAPMQHHGLSVNGTITAVDQTAKTLSVKDSKGTTVALSWNDATRVSGAPLAVGQQAWARYMEKDGKNIATSINTKAASTPKPKAK